jgi:glycosyltransferase involved in cell wall biosynthesis
MIAIVTPVYNAFNLLEKCCEAIDANTTNPYLHILVDDNSDSLPPNNITGNRFVLGLRNDFAGHQVHIGKSLQIGYRFCQDFVNFDYFFVVESDVYVPKNWDVDLIQALTLKPKIATVDILPVDDKGIRTYPTNINTVIENTPPLERMKYADLNACVFNPELFDGTWGFGDFPSHHDILLSRKWEEMGYTFHRHQLVKAFHYTSGSRSLLKDPNPGQIFEREVKYG